MYSRESSRAFVLAEDVLHAGAVADALIDGLAQLAFRMWPRWSGLSRTGWAEDTRPSSPKVFRQILNGTSGISDVWLSRALARMAEQHPPRVRHLPPLLEAEQLMRVLAGPHQLAGLWQPPSGADPGTLGANMLKLEGFVGGAKMPLFVAVPTRLRDSLAVQRFGYDALRLDALAIVGDGDTHPRSPGEAKLRNTLLSDPHLKSLFSFNQRLELSSGISHTVDVLWREGKLVVEVDGWQHMVRAHYEADLVRDGQLMAEGYVVLRVLHARAVNDTQLVIEEIRRVVLARVEQGIGKNYGR